MPPWDTCRVQPDWLPASVKLRQTWVSSPGTIRVAISASGWTGASVEGGLALTTTREVLEAMGVHDGHPRRAILALGYAGWGAGQLEREIRENVWLTVDADEALVFDDDYETKWTRALAKLHIDPQFLSAEGGRA